MQRRHANGVLCGFQLAVDAELWDSLIKLLVKLVRKVSFTCNSTEVVLGRLFNFFLREQDIWIDLLNRILLIVLHESLWSDNTRIRIIHKDPSQFHPFDRTLFPWGWNYSSCVFLYNFGYTGIKFNTCIETILAREFYFVVDRYDQVVIAVILSVWSVSVVANFTAQGWTCCDTWLCSKLFLLIFTFTHFNIMIVLIVRSLMA